MSETPRNITIMDVGFRPLQPIDLPFQELLTADQERIGDILASREGQELQRKLARREISQNDFLDAVRAIFIAQV